MRSVETWRGKTDDSKIPDQVKIRVFEKYKGTCYRSGIQIRSGDAWQIDHIIALANGGGHSEDNLAPVLIEPHKEKTKADRKIQSRIYRIKKRHLGLKKPKGRPMMGSRLSPWKKKIDGTVVKR